MSYPTNDDSDGRYDWAWEEDDTLWEDDEVDDISPEPITSPNLGVF
jgi:hypothetical protein